MQKSHLGVSETAWESGRWAHLGSNQGRIPPDRGLNADYSKGSGSGLAALYAFAVSLVVAPHLPYGVAAWAAVWSAVVFRAGSSFARRPVSDRSPASLPAPNTGPTNPAGAHTDGAA